MRSWLCNYSLGLQTISSVNECADSVDSFADSEKAFPSLPRRALSEPPATASAEVSLCCSEGSGAVSDSATLESSPSANGWETYKRFYF
ncbi:Hypothetical predicted protein [Cloeon dipterum]|uniref:Uncharacterized protein n=1 Tax=Cloeon dipterum TaxID=197152 RepID=A0A8S1CGF8_9INSE|nr:Hypothetical predicted protein [Cloeon dipterum]